jgi:hypothetical protein
MSKGTLFYPEESQGCDYKEAGRSKEWQVDGDRERERQTKEVRYAGMQIEMGGWGLVLSWRTPLKLEEKKREGVGSAGKMKSRHVICWYPFSHWSTLGYLLRVTRVQVLGTEVKVWDKVRMLLFPELLQSYSESHCLCPQLEVFPQCFFSSNCKVSGLKGIWSFLFVCFVFWCTGSLNSGPHSS